MIDRYPGTVQHSKARATFKVPKGWAMGGWIGRFGIKKSECSLYVKSDEINNSSIKHHVGVDVHFSRLYPGRPATQEGQAPQGVSDMEKGVPDDEGGVKRIATVDNYYHGPVTLYYLYFNLDHRMFLYANVVQDHVVLSATLTYDRKWDQPKPTISDLTPYRSGFEELVKSLRIIP